MGLVVWLCSWPVRLVLTKINIFAMRKIILASASPRRKEILRKTGLIFSICTSDYKEYVNLSLKPRALAKFLSRKKADTEGLKHRDNPNTVRHKI